MDMEPDTRRTARHGEALSRQIPRFIQAHQARHNQEKITSAQINEQIDHFLASGGTIKHIEFGNMTLKERPTRSSRQVADSL